MNTKTQCAAVLAHMRERGSITPIEALKRYGCFRLAARIYDLRKRGHCINAVLAKHGRKEYAAYSLMEGKRKAA